MTKMEFNWIMQELNRIKISNAKSQGLAMVFFTFSLSGFFYSLQITTDENSLLYSIFGWYFFITGWLFFVLTKYLIKSMKEQFSIIMDGYNRLNPD